MDITFLGTGGAWGIPEINCNCFICREMRQRGEKRDRTAILFSSRTNLLLDCGPDIRSQLLRNNVDGIRGVLISHEHGDHYMGLDELFAFKRNSPRGIQQPIPVYMTRDAWEVIKLRFEYLEKMGVISFQEVNPGVSFRHEEYEVFPFKTEHGDFAKGSVGFAVKSQSRSGKEIKVVYTSDFMDLPNVFPEICDPDYLIIQSFWLNEPIKNRPRHMSFQRAISFIERLGPKKETFLVHIGDADTIEGDPSNVNTKKYKPQNPLKQPTGIPYPIPLNHVQWQNTVDLVMSDLGLGYKVSVAYDDLKVRL